MDVRDTAFALWRRLPVGLRGRVARAFVERLAPRLGQISSQDVAGKHVPKIVVGFLSSPSGLGQAARLTARALIKEGFSVYGIDISRFFYEVADTIQYDLPNGKTVTGPAHVIICVNAPYLPYALFLLGRSFLKEKYVTGYWVWELQQLPASWNKGFYSVHDIVTPSSFVARAVSDLDASRPVRVAPYPVVLDLPPLSPFVTGKKRNDQPFTIVNVMNVASGYERKNPLALIGAFKLAFQDRADVRLRLLVSNYKHYPPARAAILQAVDDADNIEITWQPLVRRELWRWWGTPDVYASLHRSEGFGLPLAEAMCAGYPVVATGWSGNMEFMTSDNSFPVDFSLVDVYDPQAKYSADLGQWAEADIEHSAEIFCRLEKEPELVTSIAGEGRKIAKSALSTSYFSEQLFDSE
ncbi:MAG: glycosyltransferase [Alphaproteobacteria bacterium]|nr:glycosyltransferase [Alphaproteobacteria bacterium]